MIQPILLTTCCFPFATMAIPISEWKNYVLEISTSLQSEKLKTLSGLSLTPRIDTDLCYLYDGATVSTQIDRPQSAAGLSVPWTPPKPPGTGLVGQTLTQLAEEANFHHYPTSHIYLDTAKAVSVDGIAVWGSSGNPRSPPRRGRLLGRGRPDAASATLRPRPPGAPSSDHALAATPCPWDLAGGRAPRPWT